jgi:outer membrane usher protein FimD/PapC
MGSRHERQHAVLIYGDGDVLIVTEERRGSVHSVSVPYIRHPDQDAELVASYQLDRLFAAVVA